MLSRTFSREWIPCWNSTRDPMYPWLKDAISRDAVIITASRRLARELQAAFAAQQIAAGVLSWVTPSIHFWNDWCKRQLEDVADPLELPVPIDSFSSSVLWERCLRKHAPDGLPAMSGYVRQVREAWQRRSDWNVPGGKRTRASGASEPTTSKRGSSPRWSSADAAGSSSWPP